MVRNETVDDAQVTTVRGVAVGVDQAGTTKDRGAHPPVFPRLSF